MSDATRYRLDDLRRFGAALGAAVMGPARAANLTTHLLWFDAAGASPLGIARLPGYLDRIGRGEMDAKADGKFGTEHAATANIEGCRGVPDLILTRAAQVAGEKAREVGVGLVRVGGIEPIRSAAAVAAEMAIGPEIGLILGPDRAWSLALPSPEGLPVVFDSALSVATSTAPPPGDLLGLLAPWSLMAPDSDWLVVALAVKAIEPLSSFHERVATAMKDLGEAPGLLLPGPWDARRREAREHGVSLPREAVDALAKWAEKLGVEMCRAASSAA